MSSREDEITSRVLKKQKCVSFIHVGPYGKLIVGYKAICRLILIPIE